MQKEQKTVSVVMCTYNGEEYLRQQMDSILAQTYPISEIIVQDDGSTDSTVSILRDYAAEHSVVRIYQNERNLGFNENFRTATLRATSDFVAIADQDDVWFDVKIERLVAGIGDCDICCSDIIRGPQQENAQVVKYKQSYESLLFNPIVGHSMLLRREFAQNPRAWGNIMAYDWHLALSAYTIGRGIAKVDVPLVWHRLHGGEVTSLMKSVDETPRVWTPYLKGWKVFRQLQTTRQWHDFYSPLLNAPNIERYPVVKSILQCLLSRKKRDLLRLCLLCMRHRREVYSRKADGMIGLLRGFAFPSIYAYFNKYCFLASEHN